MENKATCVCTIIFISQLLQLGLSNEIWSYEADFIIVGSGAGGSTLASRLSEINSWKILLLEAGEEPLYFSQIPYFSVGPLKGNFDWGFFSERQIKGFQQYKNQKTSLPSGKGLGGTTLINGMLCTQGNPQDYNDWANLGNEGWSYRDLLPYFKKMEYYQITKENEKLQTNAGTVVISRPPFKTLIADVFLQACQRMGYALVDYDVAKQIGCANPVFSLKNGTRSSAYDAYLKPIRSRSNLEIVTHAYVTQILFSDSEKVNGVKFNKDGRTWLAKATKEVILSAGALKTPHILMLSGIGPEDQLKKFKISSVINLPGVGQNLQDHLTVLGMSYTLNSNIGFSFKKDVTPETLELWETKRLGPLTVPFRSEGIGFFKSNESVCDDVPDFELLLLQPPGTDLGLNKEATAAAFQPTKESDTIIVFPILLHPKSSGQMMLQSVNPDDHPLIQPNYLSHTQDVKTLIEAMKFTQKLMKTEEFAEVGVKYLGKELPGCDGFAMYSDDLYECQVHHYTSSVFHYTGTCKMGPGDDPLAVVDARLKVHGLEGLRVVDASVMPSIVSGHPMIPTIIIGEKASAMIIEEWITSHKEL